VSFRFQGRTARIHRVSARGARGRCVSGFLDHPSLRGRALGRRCPHPLVRQPKAIGFQEGARHESSRDETMPGELSTTRPRRDVYSKSMIVGGPGARLRGLALTEALLTFQVSLQLCPPRGGRVMTGCGVRVAGLLLRRQEIGRPDGAVVLPLRSAGPSTVPVEPPWWGCRGPRPGLGSGWRGCHGGCSRPLSAMTGGAFRLTK
jgi:hypothetical protein